jgi:hypothetical protein
MDWLAVQHHCPLCKKLVKKIDKILQGKRVETIKIEDCGAKDDEEDDQTDECCYKCG